jgi:hypothetical protein
MIASGDTDDFTIGQAADLIEREMSRWIWGILQCLAVIDAPVNFSESLIILPAMAPDADDRADSDNQAGRGLDRCRDQHQ